MFSDIVLKALESVGWSPNRHVPVDHWLEALVKDGYVMSDIAATILSCYGGLTIVPPELATNVVVTGCLHFDPLPEAVGDFEYVNIWQSRQGVALSPIAVYNPLLVAVDDLGRIVGMFEDSLFFIGSSLEDAMENRLIVARRKMVLLDKLSSQKKKIVRP